MNQPSESQDPSSGTASSTPEKIGDVVRDVKQTVRNKYEAFKERAAEEYEENKERLHHVEESVLRSIRKAPLKSVLVATGIGIAIGALCRHR